MSTAVGKTRAIDADLFVTLSRRMVYVAMFFLPLLAVQATKSLSVSDAIFAVSALFLAMSRRPTRARPAPGWYLGSFLMLIGAVTACYFAVSVSGSVRVVANAVYVLFVWQWVIRGTLSDSRRIVRAMTAFILGSTLSSIVAIVQTKAPGLRLPFNHCTTGCDRALGLTNQPNLMAITDATAIVFLMSIVLEHGLGRRMWRGACLGLMAVALILTGSVEGIICALVGTVIVLIRRGVSPVRVLGITALVFAVYFAGTALAGHSKQNLNPLSRFQQVTTTGSGYDTLSIRQATWDAAWGGIESSPVWGHGLDPVSGDIYYDPYVATYYPPHNVFLVFWFEGGILFLFGAGIAMVSALSRVAGRKNRDPLKDAVLGGCAVVLIAGIVGPALVDRWFWIPFVLALCFRRKEPGGTAEPEAEAEAEGAWPGPEGRRRGPDFGPDDAPAGEPDTTPRATPTLVPFESWPDLSAVSKRVTVSAQRVLTLTVADQGVSSISNFAVAVLVAHYSGARALGVFAIVMSTYIVAQGVVRSFSSDCLLTRPEVDDEVMARYERAGYLTAFVFALIASVLVLVVSLAMPWDFALPFMIFAASFPLMALQDFSRYIGISRHDPAYAIRLDSAWFVLFVAGYAVLHAEGLVSLPWLFGAWTVSGAAVGAWTLRRHLAAPFARRLRFWIRSERAVGERFAGQFLVASVSNYLIFYVLVLFVISVSTVGVMRLAVLALGPVTVMTAGVLSGLVTLATKRFRHDRGSALRFLFAAGAGMAGATALWTAFLYLLPVHSLQAVLGPTWPRAHPLLPLAGLSFMAASFIAAGTAGLRALRAAKENLRLSIALVPIVSGVPIAGAAMGGGRGYFIAAAVAGAVYAVAAWALLVRTARTADLGEPLPDAPMAEAVG